jgi:hypothetical protein
VTTKREARRFERRHRKHCGWRQPLRARVADRLRDARQWAANAAHDAPWYARKATLPVRNAAYRATRPVRSARGQYRNYRNRRFLQTGKGFWVERHTRRLRSSLPVYRNRINRATGRPRRDDAFVYRRRDDAMARMREDRLEIRGALASSREADRARVAARADAVLGPGTAERARQALAAERHDPWEQRPGRTR